MKLAATALDVAALSPAIQKALAPGPSRMMLSRGVVPLPPGELVTALYQLAVSDDAALATSAIGTATGLPDKVALAALVDEQLDARVLDWLAERLAGKAGVFDALVGNRAVADETIAGLAQAATPEQIDRIATNEQRLLRHPEIIAAMYLNPRARMSTVDRAVELAVRNQIRVPGLAGWDDIARSLAGAPSTADADALFATAAARATEDDAATASAAPAEPQYDADGNLIEPEAPAAADKDLPVGRMTVPMKMRLAALGNAFARSQLVRDPLKMVALAAIKSPGVNETEVTRYAANAGLCEDVIRYIATRGDWTKNYSVKLALVMNPKNSLADSMRQLPFLRERDLKAVMRSKNVPSALVMQARKLVQTRSGGDKKK